jgi:hypothetical protein
MYMPGLQPDLLEGDKLKRLVDLVQNYIAHDDRQRMSIEALAQMETKRAA